MASTTLTPGEEAQLAQTIEMFEVITESQPSDYQSLEILKDARIEPAIAKANSADTMQFERQGYFVRDKDSTPDRLVLNRTIALRDTFAKEVGKT